MKHFLKLILVFTLAIGGTIFFPKDGMAFTHKPGDILITKSSSSYGLTGHSGIVLPNGNVLHISGPSAKASSISIASWYSKYPATKVIRPNSSTAASNAAAWAKSHYVDGSGKNTEYRVTTNPKDLTYTYCSEIAWQSYYYGANKTFQVLVSTPSRDYYTTPSIMKPYDFLNYQNHNGTTTVYTVGW